MNRTYQIVFRSYVARWSFWILLAIAIALPCYFKMIIPFHTTVATMAGFVLGSYLYEKTMLPNWMFLPRGPQIQLQVAGLVSLFLLILGCVLEIFWSRSPLPTPSLLVLVTGQIASYILGFLLSFYFVNGITAYIFLNTVVMFSGFFFVFKYTKYATSVHWTMLLIEILSLWFLTSRILTIREESWEWKWRQKLALFFNRQPGGGRSWFFKENHSKLDWSSRPRTLMETANRINQFSMDTPFFLFSKKTIYTFFSIFFVFFLISKFTNLNPVVMMGQSKHNGMASYMFLFMALQAFFTPVSYYSNRMPYGVVGGMDRKKFIKAKLLAFMMNQVTSFIILGVCLSVWLILCREVFTLRNFQFISLSLAIGLGSFFYIFRLTNKMDYMHNIWIVFLMLIVTPVIYILISGDPMIAFLGIAVLHMILVWIAYQFLCQADLE